MSRIHDALKKAELERAEVPAPESPEPALPANPARTEVADHDALGMDSPLEPLTMQGLEKRCSKAVWKPDPKAVLFLDPKDQSPGTEEFRALRSRLYQIRDRQPLQTLLIASALPREGKTFVAVNLAQVIVQQRGRRVLLIDSDLRLSQAHRLLGAPGTPGLTEYLRGEAEPLSIMQRGPQDNLYFIPGGGPVPNPAELIGNGRLRLLLHRMAPLFDWIILDSPPAVPVTDASLLAEMCDGVLLVVRANSTPFPLSQKGCQQFQEKQLVGAVLNRVSPGATYSAYYYGYGSAAGRDSKNLK